MDGLKPSASPTAGGTAKSSCADATGQAAAHEELHMLTSEVSRDNVAGARSERLAGHEADSLAGRAGRHRRRPSTEAASAQRSTSRGGHLSVDARQLELSESEQHGDQKWAERVEEPSMYTSELDDELYSTKSETRPGGSHATNEHTMKTSDMESIIDNDAMYGDSRIEEEEKHHVKRNDTPGNVLDATGSPRSNTTHNNEYMYTDILSRIARARVSKTGVDDETRGDARSEEEEERNDGKDDVLVHALDEIGNLHDDTAGSDGTTRTPMLSARARVSKTGVDDGTRSDARSEEEEERNNEEDDVRLYALDEIGNQHDDTPSSDDTTRTPMLSARARASKSGVDDGTRSDARSEEEEERNNEEDDVRVEALDEIGNQHDDTPSSDDTTRTPMLSARARASKTGVDDGTRSDARSEEEEERNNEEDDVRVEALDEIGNQHDDTPSSDDTTRTPMLCARARASKTGVDDGTRSDARSEEEEKRNNEKDDVRVYGPATIAPLPHRGNGVATGRPPDTPQHLQWRAGPSTPSMEPGATMEPGAPTMEPRTPSPHNGAPHTRPRHGLNDVDGTTGRVAAEQRLPHQDRSPTPGQLRLGGTYPRMSSSYGSSCHDERELVAERPPQDRHAQEPPFRSSEPTSPAHHARLPPSSPPCSPPYDEVKKPWELARCGGELEEERNNEEDDVRVEALDEIGNQHDDTPSSDGTTRTPMLSARARASKTGVDDGTRSDARSEEEEKRNNEKGDVRVYTLDEIGNQHDGTSDTDDPLRTPTCGARSRASEIDLDDETRGDECVEGKEERDSEVNNMLADALRRTDTTRSYVPRPDSFSYDFSGRPATNAPLPHRGNGVATGRPPDTPHHLQWRAGPSTPSMEPGATMEPGAPTMEPRTPSPHNGAPHTRPRHGLNDVDGTTGRVAAEQRLPHQDRSPTPGQLRLRERERKRR